MVKKHQDIERKNYGGRLPTSLIRQFKHILLDQDKTDQQGLEAAIKLYIETHKKETSRDR